MIRNRMRSLNVMYLSTTLLLIVLLSSCETKDSSTSNNVPSLPEAKVTVAKVTKRIATKQIEVVGTVQAVDRAEISSKITGNITRLPVDLGTRINSGDLLVEISAGEISAQLQQASAQLAQAKRNLAREQNLLKKNAATQETVNSLKDTVKIAEASYKKAQIMLKYTKITAPFTGIVTRKIANAGDLATPGKPLLQIERENKLQIITDIPEAMSQNIKKGDLLFAYIPAVGVRVEGEVSEVSPISDPSSRTTPIKLRIKPEPHLRSGQFARVTLSLAQTETFTIPVSAVVPYGQMQRVFVENDNKANLRLVRTGALIDADVKEQYIEILTGLSENETVIVSGNQTLENGQPIIIQ